MPNKTLTEILYAFQDETIIKAYRDRFMKATCGKNELMVVVNSITRQFTEEKRKISGLAKKYKKFQNLPATEIKRGITTVKVFHWGKGGRYPKEVESQYIEIKVANCIFQYTCEDNKLALIQY